MILWRRCILSRQILGSVESLRQRWAPISSSPIGKCESTVTEQEIMAKAETPDSESLSKADHLYDLVSRIKNEVMTKQPVSRSLLEEIKTSIDDKKELLTDVRLVGEILHSCSRLTFVDDGLLATLLNSISSGHCELFLAEDDILAGMIYSHGQLKSIAAELDLMPSVRKIVEELLIPKRDPGPYQAARCIYGLGKLHLAPDDPLIPKLLHKLFTKEILSASSEKEFSMMISGLEELKVSLTDDEIEMLDSELQQKERLEGLSAIGLCNVLRRLSNMKSIPRSLLTRLVKEATKEIRFRTYCCQDLTDLVYTISTRNLDPLTTLPLFESSIMTGSMLQKFRDRELCNTIYAFALHRPEGKDELFRKLATEAIKQNRLPNYSQQGMAMMIYSFGLVKFCDLEVIQAFKEECVQPKRLESFSDQSLSNLIYGLGRFRNTDPSIQSFAVAILKEAARPPRIVRFAEQGLANILYSLAQLKLPQFVPIFLNEICKSTKIQKLKDQGLTNVIQSLCWLEYKDEEKIKLLVQEATRRISESGLEPMAFTKISATLMKMPTHPSFDAFFKKSMNKTNLTQRTNEQIFDFLRSLSTNQTKETKLQRLIFSEMSSRDRLNQLSTSQLVELLDLLRKSEAGTTRTNTQIVEEIMRGDRLNNLTVDQTGQVIQYLYSIKHSDKKISVQLATRLAEGPQAQDLSPSEIIDLLDLLHPTNIRQDLADILMSIACKNLKNLKPDQLAAALQCHASLGLRDEERIAKCISQLARYHHLRQITLKDIAIALDSTVILEMHDSEELPQLLKPLRIPAILKAGRPHYLAKAIVALCKLGPKFKSYTSSLVGYLLKPPTSDQISDSDLLEVLRAIKNVDYEYGGLGALINKRREKRDSDVSDTEMPYSSSL